MHWQNPLRQEPERGWCRRSVEMDKDDAPQSSLQLIFLPIPCSRGGWSTVCKIRQCPILGYPKNGLPGCLKCHLLGFQLPSSKSIEKWFSFPGCKMNLLCVTISAVRFPRTSVNLTKCVPKSKIPTGRFITPTLGIVLKKVFRNSRGQRVVPVIN